MAAMRSGARGPRGARGCFFAEGSRDGFVSGIVCVSNSSAPVTGTALGVGHSDDKNDVVFLLENHRIWKVCQYTLARVLCVNRVELRTGSNLCQGCPDLREKRIGRFWAAF